MSVSLQLVEKNKRVIQLSKRQKATCSYDKLNCGTCTAYGPKQSTEKKTPKTLDLSSVNVMHVCAIQLLAEATLLFSVTFSIGSHINTFVADRVDTE